VDGGFATHVLADARFCLPIPDGYSDVEAAPLLCAGLIGYRAYRLALGTAMNGDGGARNLGLYGFGAAAHLLVQIAVAQWHRVFVLTRPGDRDAQEFARSLGAHWAGDSDVQPPESLDAAILFAPVGELVPRALAAVGRGGVVVCAGIHMSDIPSFPYRLLWGERELRSVANLTRADGHEFMRVAADLKLRSHVECFRLDAANEALARVRAGSVRGAAVLTMNPAAKNDAG
jgi:propanol-preferring alcohol dehydrogenase